MCKINSFNMNVSHVINRSEPKIDNIKGLPISWEASHLKIGSMTLPDAWISYPYLLMGYKNHWMCLCCYPALSHLQKEFPRNLMIGFPQAINCPNMSMRRNHCDVCTSTCVLPHRDLKHPLEIYKKQKYSPQFLTQKSIKRESLIHPTHSKVDCFTFVLIRQKGRAA
jgi:hypothetical protein